MKSVPLLIRVFLLLLCASLLCPVYGAGPIRVLYLGGGGPDPQRHCHVLMQELGRDAIWFDFTADPAVATADWISQFDLVILEAPADRFPALAAVPPAKIVPSRGEGDWAGAGAVAAIRETLLKAAGAERRTQWESFLAQREVEKRRPSGEIANYEKRPEPLTLQEPMTVKGSMERTQVAPDLRLELFASEPDIAKPIAMAWDARGRCWLAETSDYPHDVRESGEGNDRIKICEDTDGDGRADKFTVFADKLNIPTSLVFASGGIIVAQPPRLLLLKDTNGDDRADVREVIMEGWGVKDTHAQANSLHRGLDNWLYGCVGYSGFKGIVGGRQQSFQMGTYRFKADATALEFLHQFSNNAWGHSANAAGDQFGGTANNAPIFYGGIPATAGPAGLRVMTAKRINVQDKAHAITPNFRQVDVFGGYTSAAGSAFIESANLPPRLQGKALVCEPTMKLISLMDVQPEGAGYVAHDGFNLVASSDEWMSPVFAEVGPDGAVWFADWQNFIIQHNPTPSVERAGYAAKTGVGGAHENALRDHSRGRIYRVVWKKATKPAITSLQGAASPALVAALASDNPLWRFTAQERLVDDRKVDASEPLQKLLAADKGSVGSIHALWTLQGLGLLEEGLHRSALASRAPALRRNAIRALSGDELSQRLLYGSGVVSDPDPHTRLAALVKLAEFPTTPELQTLVIGLNRDPQVIADEWLGEAARLLAKKHKAQPFREGPNLLPNSGMELTGVDGLPEGWKRRDYGNRPGNASAQWQIVTGEGQVHAGAQAVRCLTRAEADTSLHADVTVKPNTQYRLSGWIKAHALTGKLSLNDHVARAETEKVTRTGDWIEVEATYNSGKSTTASINLLQVAKGDGYFDDVKLCELIPDLAEGDKRLTGDPVRGEQIFYKHPAAACVLCHVLKGQGSTVGPALDGIASRQTPEYLAESLTEPSKVMAKGFEALGVSPMPPMGLVLKPQELADIQEYLVSLR